MAFSKAMLLTFCLYGNIHDQTPRTNVLLEYVIQEVRQRRNQSGLRDSAPSICLSCVYSIKKKKKKKYATHLIVRRN